MGFGLGFGLIEAVFPILFLLVFAVVTGTFVTVAVRGVGEWSRNNQSPRLTVDAAVVTKRTSVSHSAHTDANHFTHHTTSTSYYATFQVESGDRMEFSVSGQEYGLLAEGDTGRLSFQGTRYLNFERTGGTL